MTRPTARRILHTLVHLGFAELNDREFSLTPKVLRLGFGYLAGLPFWETAQPLLRRMAEEFGESCSIATLDGEDVVYLARIPANRALAISLRTGSRLPAYVTSLGKVMLASLSQADLEDYLRTAQLKALTPKTITDPAALRRELAEVRARGWAIVDEEREIGVRSAAAPIRKRDGSVVAAINVSANAMRVSRQDLEENYLPLLRRTAEEISSDLGFAPVG